MIGSSKVGPNAGSGSYSLGAVTKSVDNVRIWYQSGLVTACPLILPLGRFNKTGHVAFWKLL